MAIFEFPGTNFHELNLDWLLGEMKKCLEEWATVKGQFTSLENYVTNYFVNLDVSEEITNKLEEMAESGELLEIASSLIQTTVTTYLGSVITNPNSPPLDRTLTQANAAAPADLVGGMSATTNALKANVAVNETKMGAKNLLIVDRADGSNSGLTWTKNADGSYHFSGTTTGALSARLGTVTLPAGSYKLSGTNDGQILLQAVSLDGQTMFAQSQNGEDAAFTLNAETTINVRAKTFGSGKVIDQTLRPMIRYSDVISQDFVKYVPSNERLYEMLTETHEEIAVFIGDSYVQANSLPADDRSKRFSTLVCNYMGWTEKNYAVGGMGFITGNTPYTAQATNAANDSTYDHADVKYVFVCGGRNDMDNGTVDTALVPAIRQTLETLKASFPNAQMVLVPMTYDYKTISQVGYYIYKSVIAQAPDYQATVIGNAYMWLTGLRDYILSDNVHPTVAGHAIIANRIINALKMGDSSPLPGSLSLSPTHANIDATANTYCALIQMQGLITVNAIFTLSANVGAGNILFAYTSTNSRNCPTWIGNYGKHVVGINMSTGATAVFFVNNTYTDTGYTLDVRAATALTAGTWKITSESIRFGVQEYSGNMT